MAELTLFLQWLQLHRPLDYRPLFDFTSTPLFQNWVDNHRYIESHNQKESNYTLGHNQFSGMNRTEFREWLSGSFFESRPFPTTYDSESVSVSEAVDAVDAVDWRAKGAVTPVKDQQQCGSCYAFSTTGGLEGIFQINTGNLVSFSEQQILDCGDRQSGFGCHGGDMGGSYEWIGENGGLCTEMDYSYYSGETGKAGKCQACTSISGSTISAVHTVPPNSDTAMMNALAKQPVSVAIQADERDFQLYKTGVFSGACGTSLDHGVLLVGYGEMGGQDYYIMKNSWGESWGDHGYCYLGRGAAYNGGKGQCGVLMQGVYPELL